MSQPQDPLDFAPRWKRLLPSAFKTILALFLGLTALRIYGFLGSGQFNATPVFIGYLLMWLTPLVLLTPYGREQIGFGQKISAKWILIALASGLTLASLCHFLGLALFGTSNDNWFISIAATYQSDPRLALLERETAFVIFTLPALLAAPVGEEVFFRGVAEQSNRHRWTPLLCACFSASLFTIAQIAHHGIYRGFDDTIKLLPLSGTIWLLLMFGTSLVFSFIRQNGKSIWLAIIAHSAFNLAMNTYIFYSLFVSHPQTTPLP